MAALPSAETTQARPCPDGCGTLLAYHFRGMVVERCVGCAGLWLHTRDFQALEKSKDGAFIQLDEEITPLTLADDHPKKTMGKPRHCPSCATLMLPFAIHAGAPVILDRCDECEGIWADDAELAAFAEALGQKLSALASLPAELRGAMSMNAFAHLSEEHTHRITVFHFLCIHIGRRPGVAMTK